MVEISIIREWVAKADEDFEFALVNLKEGKPFVALICFHFHQSAEKSQSRLTLCSFFPIYFCFPALLL